MALPTLFKGLPGASPKANRATRRAAGSGKLVIGGEGLAAARAFSEIRYDLAITTPEGAAVSGVPGAKIGQYVLDCGRALADDMSTNMLMIGVSVESYELQEYFDTAGVPYVTLTLRIPPGVKFRMPDRKSIA